MQGASPSGSHTLLRSFSRPWQGDPAVLILLVRGWKHSQVQHVAQGARSEACGRFRPRLRRVATGRRALTRPRGQSLRAGPAAPRPRFCELVCILSVVTCSARAFECPCSSRTDENPKQHVPLAEYAENLSSMVRYLRSAGVPGPRLVLIAPPPLCEAAWERECRLQGKRRRGCGRASRPRRGHGNEASVKRLRESRGPVEALSLGRRRPVPRGPGCARSRRRRARSRAGTLTSTRGCPPGFPAAGGAGRCRFAHFRLNVALSPPSLPCASLPPRRRLPCGLGGGGGSVLPRGGPHAAVPLPTPGLRLPAAPQGTLSPRCSSLYR